MNERRRMEYLDAMGITMFVPRRILSGARASATAELPVLPPEEDQHPGEPEIAVAPVAEVPQQIEATVSGLMETLARTADLVAVAPAVPDVSSAAVVESPVQFALSIWRPSPALMILDSRDAGGALPTQALLANILRAKGLALPASKPDILAWPPAGMAPTPGWTAAREMLQAFLQARLERQPAQYLWLMGESACRAVLADRPFNESLGLVVNLDSIAGLAVVLPSLADMLQQPELKARTWAAIRAHHVS